MTFEEYLRTYSTSTLIGNMMNVGDVLALYERITALEGEIARRDKESEQIARYIAAEESGKDPDDFLLIMAACDCPPEPQDIATEVALAYMEHPEPCLDDMEMDEQAAWFKGVQSIEF